MFELMGHFCLVFFLDASMDGPCVVVQVQVILDEQLHPAGGVEVLPHGPRDDFRQEFQVLLLDGLPNHGWGDVRQRPSGL